MLTWIRNHKLAVVLVLVALVASWYFFIRKPEATYDEYTSKKSDIKETLELSGKVRASQSASLKFLAGGLITYLGPKEGDSVKKWQTIASVDSRQLQKTLDQRLNVYSIQRGTFDQTIDDNDNSVPSGDLGNTLKRLLEKNQYQLENTVSDVEYLDLSVKLSRLTSPIDGVLVQSPIETSNVQVSAADTWVVVDPTSLYFSADLDETDLKRVVVGQKAHVSLDAFPDREINSEISTISFSPKETSTGTTYEVKIKLADGDAKDLRLGLNGTVALVLSEIKGALTLPMSAVVTKNGGSYVTVKSGSKYIEKSVTTGIENDGVVEITAGLGEAENVYVKK
jgi:RND family efflux transporter MFP subunit